LKGNSKARTLAKVGRLAYSFVLFGSRDIELATKNDFQEVFSKIMQDSNLNETTRKMRVDELKRLDKEYFGNGENYTERTKWMRFAVSNKSKYLPEELINEKEAIKVINSATFIRDKALLYTLWATGARVGEIGNLRVKHFDYSGKSNEAHLMLNGKTGMRKVLIIEPVLDLLAWLEVHPLKTASEFKDSFLFCKMDGNPLTHAAVEKIIRINVARAGIKKRCNPHLWRHSRVTHLCGKGLGEMQMRHYFGWAKGSDMPSVYIHLSQRGLDSALKKSLGLEEEKDSEIVCRICAHTNFGNAKNCARCGRPLSIEGYIQLEQEKKIIEQDRNISQRVFSETFKLINEQKMAPEEAQKEAIKVIAWQLQKEQSSGVQT
jgi:site-specific recombinase XerD/ribosomal protein L37E